MFNTAIRLQRPTEVGRFCSLAVNKILLHLAWCIVGYLWRATRTVRCERLRTLWCITPHRGTGDAP